MNWIDLDYFFYFILRMNGSSVILLILAVIVVVRAFDLQGQIGLSKSDISSIPLTRGAKILVNNGIYETFVQESGKFIVHNLSDGEYIIDVVAPGYSFETVRTRHAG